MSLTTCSLKSWSLRGASHCHFSSSLLSRSLVISFKMSICLFFKNKLLTGILCPESILTDYVSQRAVVVVTAAYSVRDLEWGQKS